MTRIIEHRQDAAPGEELFELRVFRLRDGDARACVVSADLAVNLDTMADTSEPVALAYLDPPALCEDRDARNLVRFLFRQLHVPRRDLLWVPPLFQFSFLGRYWPSSIATKTMPDPTANKPHKSLMMLLTGMTKPRPTASVVAHIKPLTTEDMFLLLLWPLSFLVIGANTALLLSRTELRQLDGKDCFFGARLLRFSSERA
jgi:hypothetical protein